MAHAIYTISKQSNSTWNFPEQNIGFQNQFHQEIEQAFESIVKYY